MALKRMDNMGIVVEDLEGTIEFEATDTQTAGVVLDVLNAFVSDVVVRRHQGLSMHVAAPMDWLPV